LKSTVDLQDVGSYYNATPRDRTPKNISWITTKGTYMPMFIATMFTIGKPWEQPRYPITDEWIKKMLYLYTMELFPVTKKNEILSLEGKWMKLGNISLSEVSQAQKAKSHMCSLICGI
jgi:hypothetical protein